MNFVTTAVSATGAGRSDRVLPEAGASHDHRFVGNTTTSAYSTVESLLGGTTCKRRGETAAYWMPTLLVDGSPTMPEGATIYYRRKTLQAVTAPPAGFKMIAGTRTRRRRSPTVTFWNCGVNGGVRPSSDSAGVPRRPRSGLRLHVTFPRAGTA